jgi:hypothetical protein
MNGRQELDCKCDSFLENTLNTQQSEDRPATGFLPDTLDKKHARFLILLMAFAIG